jgi:hypothetical protein
MAYIGKQPVVGNFVKLDAIVTSATATYNLLNGGVAYFPQTANNCIVSLNGVIQSPTSAYTISGSTIVFSDALTASDSIDFILVLGDVLAIGTPSDGTVTSAKLASGTDGLFAWQSVQTTGFTAVAARAYPCNTTSSAFTVTLPASPSVGDQVLLLDYAGTFATNNLTINPNGLKIQTGTGNRVIATNRIAITLTYVDSTQGWLLSSGYLEGTNPFYVAPYSVDFLVVAGGGGGGGAAAFGGTPSAGGGAGGYRTSTQTVSQGTVITVTVGDGGAGQTGSTTVRGNNGSDSSISGSGLTTITSTGGGGGGAYNISSGAGGNGGSGGGAPEAGSGGTGTVGQGNNGGEESTSAAGGGGGAGAVGQNAPSSSQSGAGGAGSSSSITGSSVTRAGGGGGGGTTGGGGIATGAGGAGGGGAGGGQTSGGTSGTVNTGGGGGGGGPNNGSSYTTSSGGKGVVILSVPTASYSSNTSGSPTVTTSGSNTILQFNGTGSYTA